MRRDTEDGELINAHLPCPDCGSSDALSEYTNNTYCYSCTAYHYTGENEQVKQTSTNNRRHNMRDELLHGEYVAVKSRHISQKTCRKYGYHRAEIDGSPVYLANYYDNNSELVGQKVRFKDKTFRTRGDVNPGVMFGKHLFRDKGRQVIITEGEIDCLSVAEAFECKYPVVSIPNGATSAKATIKKNLEWLEGFNTIVLWFDNDEAGKKAVEEVMPLLSPGKVKVITTQYKDANEMLVAEGTSSVVSASYEAKEWRPDGILNGSELWEKYQEAQVFDSAEYPYPKMNEMFKGLRKGELVTFTAGSGMGKSTVVREIAYDLMLRQDKKIGYIALEENWRSTLTKFLGMYANKPLFYDDELNPEEKKEAWDETIGKDRLYLYDHFGSMETDNLMSKIRVMIHNCGVDYIVLDHISIVISGMEGGDERRSIDNLMTMLRSVVEETNVGMLLISHLRRASGDKGHEDGAQITLSQLRGSGAIAQLSDAVIGLERDAQSEEAGDRIRIRVLKNRFGGALGKADTLNYNHDTGRIECISDEFEGDFDDEENSDF